MCNDTCNNRNLIMCNGMRNNSNRKVQNYISLLATIEVLRFPIPARLSCVRDKNLDY